MSKKMSKRWSLVIIAAVALVVILAACSPSGTDEPKKQVIDIYMGEVKAHGLDSLESVVPEAEEVLVAEFHVWVPNIIVVSKGDTVQLNVTNPRSGVHGLGIPDLNIDTGPLAPRGGTATVEFVAAEAGTFGFECNTEWDNSVDPRICDPDHEFMTGTLIVLDR